MIDLREQDIQILCKAVIDKSITWVYGDNSFDRYECIFYHVSIDDDQDYNKIKHELNCPVLIAKDLMSKG